MLVFRSREKKTYGVHFILWIVNANNDCKLTNYTLKWTTILGKLQWLNKVCWINIQFFFCLGFFSFSLFFLSSVHIRSSCFSSDFLSLHRIGLLILLFSSVCVSPLVYRYLYLFNGTNSIDLCCINVLQQILLNSSIFSAIKCWVFFLSHSTFSWHIRFPINCHLFNQIGQ